MAGSAPRVAGEEAPRPRVTCKPGKQVSRPGLFYNSVWWGRMDRGAAGTGGRTQTGLAPWWCHQLGPQVQWTHGLAGGVCHTFSFPPQHRFLPCENKSEAVEQVKSAFSKVSAPWAHPPRGRGWQVPSRPHPRLGGTVGTRHMV